MDKMWAGRFEKALDEMADDVAVMYKGKIVEMNSKEEIFKNPKEQYTKDLFAAIPGKYQA